VKYGGMNRTMLYLKLKPKLRTHKINLNIQNGRRIKFLRIDESRNQAKANSEWWGLCAEEIDWGRMRKTSGNKTTRQRIKAAKLMNGKRATKDRLKIME
jgi:hypothetical protein